MPLSDYVIPTRKIILPGDGSFFVRGMSLEDISFITSRHLHQLVELFEKIKQEVPEGKDKKPEDINQIIRTAITTAPEAVATIIALAADEPEQTEMVSRLPVSIQTEAIMAVVEMTFESEAHMGKFMQAIVKAMTATTNTLQNLQSPASLDGSGVSEET